MNPVLVDPFLGAGGTVLGLLSWVTGAKLDPPVSWMGGKRRLALEGLAPLDLPRRRIPMLLADASWWGWVWLVCLDAVTGPKVSAVLRSWRGEDPRALWFRLRDEGPREDLAEAAAQILWLQARAASGVPVWWEGGAAVQWASTKIDTAGQRQATEPRLIQMANGRGPYVASMAGDMLLSRGGGAVPPSDAASITAICQPGARFGARTALPCGRPPPSKTTARRAP